MSSKADTVRRMLLLLLGMLVLGLFIQDYRTSEPMQTTVREAPPMPVE
ncbi:MAG: hypothetical protein V4490_00585 [Pseudomonadota bacterium]